MKHLLAAAIVVSLASACTFPQVNLVIFFKNSFEGGYEVAEFVSSTGTVLSSLLGIQSSSKSDNLCVDPGTYKLVMKQTAGSAWGEGAYYRLSQKYGAENIPFLTTKLTISTEDSLSFNVGDLVPPMVQSAAQEWKYYVSTTAAPATTWKSNSFDDSAWTSVTQATRPSLTENVMWFRKTFTLASKTGFQGFEILVKKKANYIIYVNGNELYSYGITGDPAPTSTASTGTTYGSWAAVSGKMSLLNTGSNVIAIAIVEPATASPLTMEFDCSLRLLSFSNKTPRSLDYMVEHALVDLNFETHSTKARTAATVYETLQFTNDRAETINKYCVRTATKYDETYDVTAWVLSGSNDGTGFVTLHTVQNVFWSTRGSTSCFFMNSVSKPYRYYRFDPTAGTVGGSMYAINQVNLYLEDLDNVVAPALQMETQAQVGYVDSFFPEVGPTSPYYSEFSVSPALPSPLVVNFANGMIRGRPSATYPATPFTLSAKNHKGETATTSITIAVNVCGGDMVSFSLTFIMASGAEKCNFALKEKNTGSVKASRSSFVSSSTVFIPLCEVASLYTLTLGHTDSLGWGSSKVLVKLYDGLTILSEALATGSLQKDYDVNVQYIIPPNEYSWQYIVTKTDPPANWYKQGVTLSESTATKGNYPVAAADAIVQYYATQIIVTDVSEFAVLDISCVFNSGMVLYVNGLEMTRYNMPTGTITSSTYASKTYGEPKKVTSGVSVQLSDISAGPLKIAFSLHRHESETAPLTNPFDAHAIFILDQMFMMFGGSGTSQPIATGNEGTASVFDNNVNTKMLTTVSCTNVKLEWKWDDDRRETINWYAVVNANDCNTRHPSAWMVEGSNDGELYTKISEDYNIMYDAFFQQRRIEIYTTKPYNRYRLTSLECKNPVLPTGAACGTNIFQLADIYLFAYRLPGYCQREGDFAPTTDGQYSKIPCPDVENYTGEQYRLCTGGVFSDVQVDCKPKRPTLITYEETEHVLTVGKEAIIKPKEIKGVEYYFTVVPEFNNGSLKIDKDTGVISGVPDTEREKSRHTVVLANTAGSVNFSMYFTVQPKPTNVLVVVIIVVVVVVIVVGIVALVLLSRKGGNSKKKSIKNSRQPGKAAKARV